MIAFLIMIPTLLFMAGILAVATAFSERQDPSSMLAQSLRAERESAKHIRGGC